MQSFFLNMKSALKQKAFIRHLLPVGLLLGPFPSTLCDPLQQLALSVLTRLDFPNAFFFNLFIIKWNIITKAHTKQIHTLVTYCKTNTHITIPPERKNIWPATPQRAFTYPALVIFSSVPPKANAILTFIVITSLHLFMVLSPKRAAWPMIVEIVQACSFF